MKAAGFSETSIPIYQTTQCHIPGDLNFLPCIYSLIRVTRNVYKILLREANAKKGLERIMLSWDYEYSSKMALNSLS